MIQLTPEQTSALRLGEKPPRAFDPSTSTTYVLIPMDLYDRAKGILTEDDDDFAASIYHQSMKVFGRDGWDDPAMDIYNDLDPRRQL